MPALGGRAAASCSIRPPLPGRSGPWVAVGASTLRVARRASPRRARARSGCPDCCRVVSSRRTVYSPSVWRVAFRLPDSLPWPRLGSRSLLRGCPFGHSPGNGTDLPRTTGGSTPPPFDRTSFAALCPLALEGVALYPVSVRRPAVSRSAAFGADLAVARLGVRSKSPRSGSSEDVHLRVRAWAGHA